MQTQNPISGQDYLQDIDDENFGYNLASPLTRLGAAIIEGIIISVPYFIIFGIGYSEPDFGIYDFHNTIYQLIVSAVLGAITYALWSANFGHKILGLKVISAVDGSDQKNASTGAIRELLKSLLGIFILPSIWLLWDPKKQNLYDKITKTLVVHN